MLVRWKFHNDKSNGLKRTPKPFDLKFDIVILTARLSLWKSKMEKSIEFYQFDVIRMNSLPKNIFRVWTSSIWLKFSFRFRLERHVTSESLHSVRLFATLWFETRANYISIVSCIKNVFKISQFELESNYFQKSTKILRFLYQSTQLFK